MPKDGRYAMGGRKGKGGKGYLGKDAGGRSIPGFLGRSTIKSVQGRTGYTEGEMRVGPSEKGRKIPLPGGS